MSTANATVASHGISIDAQLLDELHRVDHRHASRAVCFVVLYVVSAFLACGINAVTGGGWIIASCLPLYLVAAASLHGISLFTHEGVHGALSRDVRWNRALSILCALPVMQNFSAYKVLHLRHHKHLGQEGDPDHYDNYTSWTWLVFVMNWLRLFVGYPVYLVAIPVLGFRQGEKADRWWIAFEVVLLLAICAAVLVSPIPWAWLLHGWLIPMLIINTLVNIRGMSQHTFLEDSADPVSGTRSILTNRITEYFMCNENYHLEHHLFPRVPWYNLRRLHGELQSQLIARRAPFIPSYFAFVREFAIGSWRRSPLGRGR